MARIRLAMEDTNNLMKKVVKEQKRAGKVEILYSTLQLVLKESDEKMTFYRCWTKFTDGTSSDDN